MTLPERLIKLRKSAGLSQEEVADKLEVTRQTVSKWETGQSSPDLDKISPLCNLYGVTPDDLIHGSSRFGKPSEQSATSDPSLPAEFGDRPKHPTRKSLGKIMIIVTICGLAIGGILALIGFIGEKYYIVTKDDYCAMATEYYYTEDYYDDEQIDSYFFICEPGMGVIEYTRFYTAGAVISGAALLAGIIFLIVSHLKK